VNAITFTIRIRGNYLDKYLYPRIKEGKFNFDANCVKSTHNTRSKRVYANVKQFGPAAIFMGRARQKGPPSSSPPPRVYLCLHNLTGAPANNAAPPPLLAFFISHAPVDRRALSRAGEDKTVCTKLSKIGRWKNNRAQQLIVLFFMMSPLSARALRVNF
jgi:hypothetical protein